MKIKSKEHNWDVKNVQLEKKGSVAAEYKVGAKENMLFKKIRIKK